jgi:hypothetical protein
MFHASSHSRLHSKEKGMGPWQKTIILIEPNEIVLARWVDRALNQGLVLKHHIKV